jgi:hypothetical protein
MATAVSICSNALLRLGADTFNSFSEGDVDGSNIERVRLCSNLWPTIRRQVLRSHLWNCAIKRVVLSPLVDPPEFGYSHKFQRPGDWLRTIAVGEKVEAQVDYKTESGHFLCNETAFYLTYIFDNENPATYDSSLVDALELSMAVALAYPVTKSAALADALAAELRGMMALARSLDTVDDPPQTLGDFPLYSSRFGNRLR